MAGTFTKIPLSGSTNGKQIKITTTASAGDLIHTAVSGTSSNDEIWLYADNDSTGPVLLTIQYGGTTDIDNTIKVTVPARASEGSDGLKLVLSGLILQNSLVVRAFAASANVIKISGYVHRIA